MNIGIIGLGYVGQTLAACLPELGHRVWGYDVDVTKMSSLARGVPTISEHGVGERLSANPPKCEPLADLVKNCKVIFLCVGTPPKETGEPSLWALEAAIGALQPLVTPEHLLVMRSTVLPGTTEALLGWHPRIAFNPEFLREGTAVSDFFNAPRTVWGGGDFETAPEIYANLSGYKHFTGIREAELVKYMDNAWHATKITFSNEMRQLADSLGLDVGDVFGMFLTDEKLNLGRAYLKPGFAFGGSCLPKDLKALEFMLASKGLSGTMLRSLNVSNDLLIEDTAYDINKDLDGKPSNILIIGRAFKANTDDERNSPGIALAAHLGEFGHCVDFYDPLTKNTVSLETAIETPWDYVVRMTSAYLPSLQADKDLSHD